MATFTAREAKNRLGAVLAESQHEDVTILKNGEPYAVVISHRRYLERRGAEGPERPLRSFIGAGGAPLSGESPEAQISAMRDEWER